MIGKNILFAAAMLLAASGPVAAQGGGESVPGNVDIRALEPPVDVRPKQLQAQEPPHASAGSTGTDGSAGAAQRAPQRAPE